MKTKEEIEEIAEDFINTIREFYPDNDFSWDQIRTAFIHGYNKGVEDSHKTKAN